MGNELGKEKSGEWTTEEERKVGNRLGKEKRSGERTGRGEEGNKIGSEVKNELGDETRRKK